MPCTQKTKLRFKQTSNYQMKLGSTHHSLAQAGCTAVSDSSLMHVPLRPLPGVYVLTWQEAVLQLTCLSPTGHWGLSDSCDTFTQNTDLQVVIDDIINVLILALFVLYTYQLILRDVSVALAELANACLPLYNVNIASEMHLMHCAA